MSILKRFLTEDLAARKRAPSAPPSEERKNPGSPDHAAAAQSRGASPTARGLTVVILNWSSGENDPFSVFSAAMQRHFQARGRNVEVIEIAADDWPVRLTELARDGGVEFAFTWQGQGSDTALVKSGRSLWEHLGIPLICVHGDHPSHMPENHALESLWCIHLYNNAEFARYSNRYFRRRRGASVIDIPQLHHEHRRQQRVGDYFVFAKNVDHPQDTETLWRERLGTPLFDVYMRAAEDVKARIAREAYLDIHDALDDAVIQHGLEAVSPAVNLAAHHRFHRLLDLYLRAHKSIAVVTAARDFPLRIYGRGWDRVARSAPPHHVFEPGRNMADSQSLYYSRFGIIDVSPSKVLHDRTRRAMVNGTGFLSSASLEDSFPDIRRFEALFYSFQPNVLAQRCAAVVRDPEAHAEAAQTFADAYHTRFQFAHFVDRLDQLVQSVRSGSWST